MGWFVAVLVILYISVAVFCAKRYYVRRHGVIARHGEPGTSTAGLIGMLWPATMWFQAIRNPALCSRHRHILEYERLRQEVAVVEELKAQRRR
jgi:hypothetical protein